MKQRYIGAILAGLAFAAWGCRGDPTATFRSGPALLSLSINFGFLEVGKQGPVLVVARDAQLIPCRWIRSTRPRRTQRSLPSRPTRRDNFPTASLTRSW